MPSTLGHTIAGAAVAQLFRHREGHVCTQAVLMANAADLDMLPGLLTRGHPNAMHARASHSLGAALMAGVGAGMLATARGRRFGPRFFQAAAAYGSHVLLDYCGKEGDDGVPLLWPLSSRRYAASRRWFKTILSHSKKRGFWLGLLNRSNVSALVREVGLLAPVYLLARLAGGRR